MRDRDEVWKALTASNDFNVEARLYIGNDETEYTDISAPKIDRTVISNPLSIGNCATATLTVSILTDDEIEAGAKVKVKARLYDSEQTSEWLEFGTYYIDTRDTAYNGLVTLTCYDAMNKTDMTWVADDNYNTAGWPKAMSEVVEMIADTLGVEVDERTELYSGDDYMCDLPSDMTIRDVLQGIAAVNGGNWVITEDNKLRLIRLSTALDSVNDSNAIITENGEKILLDEDETILCYDYSNEYTVDVEDENFLTDAKLVIASDDDGIITDILALQNSVFSGYCVSGYIEVTPQTVIGLYRTVGSLTSMQLALYDADKLALSLYTSADIVNNTTGTTTVNSDPLDIQAGFEGVSLGSTDCIVHFTVPANVHYIRLNYTDNSEGGYDDFYYKIKEYWETTNDVDYGYTDVPIVCGSWTTGQQSVVSAIEMSDNSSNEYSVGDDSGTTITVSSCPYASQSACEKLYKELNGLKYIPYTAAQTVYDPAAECGDYIEIGDAVNSILFNQTITLDIAFVSDISAPSTQESEYPYLGETAKLTDSIQSTNAKLESEIERLENSITLAVKESASDVTESLEASLVLKVDENAQTAVINADATTSITLNSNQLIITAGNFTLDSEGDVAANDLTLTGDIALEGDMYLSTDADNIGAIHLGDKGRITVGDTSGRDLSMGYNTYTDGSALYSIGSVEDDWFIGDGTLYMNSAKKVYIDSATISIYGESGSLGYSNSNGSGHMFGPSATNFLQCGLGGYTYFTTSYAGAVSAVSYSELSDKKQKDHIAYLDEVDGLKDFFMSLKPVEFKWKNSGERTHMGFYAQDVAENAKATVGDIGIYDAKVVDEDDHTNLSDYTEDAEEENLSWSLRYNEFIAPTVAMVQAQQKQIENLQEQITELQDIIKSLLNTEGN